MSAVWSMFFQWMPPILYYAMLGMLALIVIIIVFKIVAFVLDVLPFV